MSTELSGRTAIVTGAASGIGRAIALRYAAAGAAVLVVDVASAPWHGGEPTERLIRQRGGTAEFASCDLADTAAVESVFAQAVRRFGRIDLVVDNAAISAGKPLLETDDAAWRRVMDVNVTAVFTLCRAAVRHMREQTPRGEVRGRIINITSQHGMVAARDDAAYGVSKAAITQLTRQIAAGYAADGIVCNAIAPGKIDTGPTERSSDPAWQDYWTSRTPWPRLGRPEEVAEAALFLARDEATYITGTTVMVDGGWMAS